MTVFVLPKGFRPESIILGENIGEQDHAYLGSLADGSIYRLNLRNGTGEVVFAGTGAPAGGVKLADTGRLYVAGGFAGDARVIDLKRGELVAGYQLAEGRPCLIADVVLAFGAAWFTDAFHPVLYRLDDAEDHGRVTEIPLSGDVAYVDGEYNIGGIASTPDGRALLISQANTGEVFRVDPATGSAKKVDLAGELLPSVDGLTICKSTLYAAQGLVNEVAIIDLSEDGASGSVRKRLTSEQFDIPTSVAPQGAFLYIVNSQLGRELDPAAEYTVVAVQRPPMPGYQPQN